LENEFWRNSVFVSLLKLLTKPKGSNIALYHHVLIYLISSLYIALKGNQYLAFFIFREQIFSRDDGRFLQKIPEKDKLCVTVAFVLPNDNIERVNYKPKLDNLGF